MFQFAAQSSGLRSSPRGCVSEGIQITVMAGFPNAPLYERMAAAGRLLQPEAWETCTLFDVNDQPEGMSVSKLENGFRDLTQRMHDSDFIESRRRWFFTRQSELRRLRSTETRFRETPSPERQIA